MKIIALCGMVGIGKTTLAKECFEDPSILCCFDHSVLVTLGPTYHSENILVDILAQIYPFIDKLSLKGDVTLIDDLCTQLSDKRCLIVFDDVWSEEPIHYLKMLAPDIKGESIMTTRLMTVAKAMGGCWRITERNVVMVAEKGSKYEIKTCYLHSVFWNLSNNLAEKKKFFHAFNIYTEDSLQGLESQRRLSIRNNTLLGIKKVDNSNASYSTLRSLLCTGPYHQYPVPIFSGLRLLRVFDALTIRFYEFPTEIWELFNLRFLALTCNGVLPSSIKRLWNLQFLIVNKHWTITYVGTQLYLPLEIWDMKNLRHHQFVGSSLPNPHCGVDLLPNLSTPSHLSSHNLTKRIVKRIHYLKKLGIQVQLAFNDDGKSFHSLNSISRLRKLESLKCVVLNPGLMFMGVTPPAPLSMFPSSLQKLHLSGLGYPWDCTSIIGSLPKLYELKLTCYAFRGPLWEAYNGSFKELKFLTIEDTDLVRWKIKVGNFLTLKYLSLKYCFKLQELPSFLIIRTINVVDCNPLVENWTEQMQEERLKYSLGPEFSIKLYVKSSWNAHGDIEY